jgi:hypothetical protein
MKRSSLDELVRAERRSPPRPSGTEAKATWTRIQHDLGVAAVPLPFDVAPAAVVPVAKTGLLASVTAKVTVAAVVAGGGAAAALLSTDRESEPTSEVATVSDASEPVADGDDEPPAVIETTKDPEPESARGDELTEAEPVPNVVTPDPQARSTRGKRQVEPRTVSPEGIGREVELVKRAGKALSAGDHAEALRVLDEHAREFPQGTMIEDRSALYVLALCAAGRSEEAQRAKRTFLARWPRSVHAERLEDGCTASSRE